MAGKKSQGRRVMRSVGGRWKQKRKEQSAAASIPSRIPQRKPTNRHQVKEPDQAAQRLLLLITRIQSLFIDEESPTVVFGALLQELLTLTDSEYGFIGEVAWTAEQQPFLRTHAITDIAWSEATKALIAEQAPTLEFRNLKTLFGHVMTTGKPVIANDPAHDPRAGGLPPGPPPMHAFLGLPLYRSEQLLGMVGIANRPGGYDDALVAYLEPFLSTCAQLLEGYHQREQRGKVEAALRMSEARQEFLLSATTVMIYSCEAGGDFGVTFVSENIADLMGYRREDCLADPRWWVEGIHPDDRARVLAELPRLFESGTHVHEYRFRHKDGTYRWMRDELRVVHDAEGRPIELVGCWVDVTERRQAEEYLRRTQFAMDQAVDAVYWIDPQARILYANEAASTMLGYTAEEFLRLSVHDLNPDFPPEVWPGWWEETREKKVISLETAHRTKDGRRIPVDIRVSFLAYGGQEFHCAFVRDLTTRKRAEEEQRHVRMLLTNVINTTPDFVFVKDQNLRTVLCNQAFARAVGKEPEDLVGHTDIENGWDPDLVHGSSDKGIRGYEQDDRATMSGQVVHNPNDLVRINGTTWIFDTFKVPLRDEHGEIAGVLGIARDVTERKRMEAALQESYAELEHRVQERTSELAVANVSLQSEITERKRTEVRLLESERQLKAAQAIAHLGSWELDVVANRLTWSDETYRMFGLQPQEFDATYEAFLERVHSDDRTAVDEAYSGSLREGCDTYEIEHRIVVHGTGEIRVVHEKCVHIRDESGQIVKSIGMVHDVTERKRAEEAIRESELRYKLLTEATFDGIAIHDQGILLEVNTGLERMFGYAPGELIGRSMWDLIADESRDLVLHNIRNHVNGPYEAIGRRKDGTMFPGEVMVRPYRYRGKEVRLVAGRDITERKHLEAERLRHTEELERQVIERTAEIVKLEAQRAHLQKMVAVGRLAAGVAHEINNPIAGIKNAFELVKQAVAPGHAQAEFVGMIDREIARVSSIVQNMYQLYRRESGKVETVDIRTMIGDMEILFAKQLQQRQLRLVVQVDPGFHSLEVPRSDLLQVLLNLLTNAMDCSREGGTITMTIREEGEVVRIAVADEGSGITPEILPHIFDPFFTTKTEGVQKGMGLGLSISQTLVAAMGGRIDVHTQWGEGSTFSLLLPRHKTATHVLNLIHHMKEVMTHDD